MSEQRLGDGGGYTGNPEREAELKQGYIEVIQAQNPDADPTLIEEVAEDLLGMLIPWFLKVDDGSVPYFQLSTKMQGLNIEITQAGVK